MARQILRRGLLVLLAAFGLLYGTVWALTQPELVISELQAGNESTLVDEEADHLDRNQIHHRGATVVYLPVVLSSIDLNPLQDKLHKHIQTWLANDRLARSDGYVYAIDIGQLLIYFANEGDLENYTTFRNLAVEHLIRNDPSDPYTQGFVGWRYKEGKELDASGTTEALWIAKGLWLGNQEFDEPADQELALQILNGYARHEYIDQGIWFIRNYFNFGTRAFSINSYLVDYYPDFVQEVANTTDDSELTALAQNSLDLIRQGKAGDDYAQGALLHSIVMPEIKTFMPDLDVVAFSPNDIIQLSNACAIAEMVVESDRELAKQVLDFADSRIDNLEIYYYGRTGEAASGQPASTSEWTCFTRLAAKLNETTTAQNFMTQARPLWEHFGQNPYEPRLYIAGQILLSIQAIKTPWSGLDSLKGRSW